jgi:hypothetical protein
MWKQFHGCPASGGGIERVFGSAGKQHALKKKARDKTLESTLKASINTKLPTCDDKGVFTRMMMTHTGNTNSLRWKELGKRKGVEVVVT